MTKTRNGACPFCSTRTTLYAIADATGRTWWACRTVTNLDMPDFTCWSAWRRVVEDPAGLAIAMSKM